MLACPRCGQENPSDGRFCHACAAPLAESSTASHEVRKIVTVVFCDIVDSTPLAERLDAESLRQVMSRYFDEMRAALERHGGTVEKFIGDAIMAVFGVPTLHEDDALRAVRAAAEMRDLLAELNDVLTRCYGVLLETRIGVNTGEVVAGDGPAGQTLVTGDAVNVAKRLEEAAGPGEILIGTETYRLVRDSADLRRLDPVVLKGKEVPVTPWRLLEVRPTAHPPPRRLDAPLVGREAELGALVQDVDAAVAGRSCRLATLLGAAGIGKSRLALELLASVSERATSLTGRCLPYGEGITFWPVGEMVRQLGDEPGLRQRLSSDPEADLVVERVLGATGAADAAGGEETFWAARRLFEALARRRPLVLVFEDIHWAEPTLLDLIEYLAGWIRDAPVVLLCLARPDLLDRHPAWVAPRPNARVIALEPLSEQDTELLLSRLGSDGDFSVKARNAIAEAAEGNPLFVEQMVAMLAEEETPMDRVPIPPSIHALLAARLDRLSPDERTVLESAAVVGKEFSRGAVRELVPAEFREAVGAQLMTLVRKELIRPAPSSAFEHDDAFRFRHALVRDAAYEGLSKKRRADLHERFAVWIDEHAGERASELEEIVGYHLEQAYRLRAELGPVDGPTRRVGARAGEVLASAGRRALVRSDMPAATNLLGRALELGANDDHARPLLLRDLSAALWAAGRFDPAEAALSDALAAAVAAGDRRVEWYARLDRATRRSLTATDAAAELGRVSEEAVAVFEELGDDLGLARAWRGLARAARVGCRFAEVERAAERALAYAEAAADPNETAEILDLLFTALLYGPAPAGRASARCAEIAAGAARDRFLEANAASSRAGLEAMLGDFDEARALVACAAAIYDELGRRLFRAGLGEIAGPVELLAGRPDEAEKELRLAFEILAESGDTALLGYPALMLAETLLAAGRDDEARHFAEIGKAAISPDDTTDQVLARMVEARLLARHDDLAGAESEAREAVALASRTDALALHADAVALLGELQLAAERPSEARETLERAVELYELKGHAVGAERARETLRGAGAEHAPTG